MRAGHLEQGRGHRPRLVLGAFGRRLDADGQVGDGQRLLTMGSSDAVGPGVAAAKYHNMLAICRQLVVDAVPSADAILLHQIVHRKVNTGQVSPRYRQLAGHQRASGNNDRVVASTQIRPAYVDTNRDACTESGALRLHLFEPQLQMLFLHFEVGDAIAQQAADAIIPLENSDHVTCPGELLRRCKPCRTRTNDGDRLSGQALWRMWFHPVVRERLVDDRNLDLLDGYRRLADTQHAGALARCRAEPASELREIVGRMQPFDRLTAFATVHQVVPLRDQVSERTALVAKRYAAIHAAAGLAAHRCGVPQLIDLFPVHQSNGHRASRG